MKLKINSFLDVLIVIVFLIILGHSLYLIHVGLVYKSARDTYDSKKNSIIVDGSGTEERSIDFERLQEESSSSCAWIYIPGTNIDYPLVYGNDNSYYLSHDAYGNSSSSGAIFLNCDNNDSLNDSKSIIYGHNMKDGSMFHDLRYYTDETYAEEHSFLYIYMDNGTVRKYKMHSSSLVDSNDPTVYIPSTGESVEAVLSYIDSFSDAVYTDSTSENIIILSTCQTGNNRRVVVFQECD